MQYAMTHKQHQNGLAAALALSYLLKTPGCPVSIVKQNSLHLVPFASYLLLPFSSLLVSLNNIVPLAADMITCDELG